MNINELLAKVDNSRRVTATTIRDLINNPRDFLAQIRGGAADSVRETADRDRLLRDQVELRRLNSVMADAPQYKAAEAARDADRQRMTDTVMNFAPLGMMVGPRAASWGKGILHEMPDPTTPHGTMKAEISDANARVHAKVVRELMSGRDGLFYTAKDFLNHPDLYREYPWLANMPVTTSPSSGGVYWTQRNRGGKVLEPASIEIGLRNDDPKTVMLHELQHAIQQIEGWSPGGSTDTAYNVMKKLGMDKGRSQNEVGTGELYKVYQRLAGEAEARNTQARAGMSYIDRRLYPIEDTYDVPIDKLIFTRPNVRTIFD